MLRVSKVLAASKEHMLATSLMALLNPSIADQSCSITTTHKRRSILLNTYLCVNTKQPVIDPRPAYGI